MSTLPPMHLTYHEAGDGIRTRDPQLGKLMLYQLSYSRTARTFKLVTPVIPLSGSWARIQRATGRN
jgi:hypothetical protein